MKTVIIAALISGALAAVSLAEDPPAPSTATIDHCMVSLEPISGQSLVPAQEAGVLKEIKVREGQSVHAGELLAQIDDMQSQKQLKNAQAEYRAAYAKAKNDIEFRYAKKAADVGEFTYLKQKQSADKVPGAVTEVDLQKYKLDWERAVLQIDQAVKNQELDTYTAQAKYAEAELAEEGVKRRQILAPIDGIVVRIDRNNGEWVKPGDTVLRLLRIDRLSVEGSLKYNDYEPGEIANQPVMLDVELAHGHKAQFPGKIVFVDPEVTGGSYKVRAEIENRKENDQWLLLPGLNPTVTIQFQNAGQPQQQLSSQ